MGIVFFLCINSYCDDHLPDLPCESPISSLFCFLLVRTGSNAALPRWLMCFRFRHHGVHLRHPASEQCKFVLVLLSKGCSEPLHLRGGTFLEAVPV